MTLALRHDPKAHRVTVEVGTGLPNSYLCTCGRRFDYRHDYEDHLRTEAERLAQVIDEVTRFAARHDAEADRLENAARSPWSQFTGRCRQLGREAQFHRRFAHDLRRVLAEQVLT